MLSVTRGSCFSLSEFTLHLGLYSIERGYGLEIFNPLSRVWVSSSWNYALGPVCGPGQVYFVRYSGVKYLKGFHRVLPLVLQVASGSTADEGKGKGKGKERRKY